MSDPIADVVALLVRAARHTNWVFLRITTQGGAVGVGEAALSGEEQHVADAVPRVRPGLVGSDAFAVDAAHVVGSLDLPAAVATTVASALDQALWDLRSRRLGMPLWRVLGGRPDPVPLYANINRGAEDRSAGGLASIARRAVDDGFVGVKCAPFDGLTRDDAQGGAADDAVARAAERVTAIRDAIGPDAQLMVDAHWRLTPRTARTFLEAVSACRLAWLEDPFPEVEAREWTDLAADTQVPLAGGERATSLRDLARALAIGQYRIACPDVRHVGGVATLWHAAHLVDAHGAAFAPHNPRGPVGTVATGHVAAAAPNVHLVEFPYGECAWRDDLTAGGERIVRGQLHLSDAPGLGVAIADDVASLHPFEPVAPPRTYGSHDVW